MDTIAVFKICDVSRLERYIITSSRNVMSLMKQGTLKLNKPISQIVLENDGCQITDDFALAAFANNLLMLLTTEERWASNIAHNLLNDPGHTTVTGEDVVLEQSYDIQGTVNTEPVNQFFLPDHQLPHNLLTIITNPNTNSSEADPIAMQLMTDMDSQDEECLQQQSLQHLDGTDIMIGIEEPTCSKYIDGGVVSNRNVNNVKPSSSKLTHHVQEPGYQKSNKKHATSAMKFRSFEINWTKISDGLIERLNNLQEFRLNNSNTPIPWSVRLKKSEMTSLVNCVVDQLRCIDPNIKADIMENVAKQMMQKYPCLEILDDDGFSNGLSHITIKHKMINHNTYLNRLKNEAPKATVLIPEPKNRRAGTMQEYWNVSANQCSKEMLSKLRRDEPVLLTAEFLIESQGFVRSRLDQTKDLSVILTEFPVLRRRQLLTFHFKQATGVDIEMMQKYYNSKKAKIIEYSSTHRAYSLNESSSDYAVFNFLAKLVNETLDDLILKKEIGTRIDEIGDETAGPVLISIDIGNGTSMYYVFAEQTRLTDGTKDILCALQDLMSVHYVHSFMYLKRAAKFLELVQEYLLKIFPSKGTKSNAVRVGKQQRTVRKVITSLSLYESSSDKKASVSVSSNAMEFQ